MLAVGIQAFSRSLRTDQNAGLLVGIFGLAMMGFAVCGLAVIEIQRAMLGSVGAVNEPDAAAFVSIATALHHIWWTYLPCTFLGGMVFAIAGFYVTRGSLHARRVSQLNALAGILWSVGYICSCGALINNLPPQLAFPPEPFGSVFRWVSLATGSVMSLGIPVSLLFLLSRPTAGVMDAEVQ